MTEAEPADLCTIQMASSGLDGAGVCGKDSNSHNVSVPYIYCLCLWISLYITECVCETAHGHLVVTCDMDIRFLTYGFHERQFSNQI